MALTLNQILARLRTLQQSHEQLNTFLQAKPEDFDIQGGDVIYPALFCEIVPGVIDRVSHLTNFNFKLYFYDLIKISEGTDNNQEDVFSDMMSVAQDYLAMLMSFNYQDDWVIKDTANFEIKEQQTNDSVGGAVLDVGISIDFLADRCVIPAEDITFETIDMARTKIVPYTGGASETSTVTVTGLAGKIVLAIYRAGFYKRAITTVPVDFDSIKITGTDQLQYKGILSSDGTAVLQAGDALQNGEVLDFLVWSN